MVELLLVINDVADNEVADTCMTAKNIVAASFGKTVLDQAFAAGRS
jgi:hypothetical protein